MRGLQQKEEAVEVAFYTGCYRYFKENQKGLLTCKNDCAEEARDLFQDAYLILWDEITSRRIHIRNNCLFRYDRKGDSRCMSATLQTYLMSIIKNKGYERVREEELYVRDPEDPEDPADPSELEPEISREDIVALAVDSLPKRCQEILTLFYYEQKNLDEILAVRKENISKDGLKSGKSKCMGQLRERILAEFKKYRL